MSVLVDTAHGTDAARDIAAGATLARWVARRRFAGDAEFARWATPDGDLPADGGSDYLFLSERDDHRPEEVFGRLRWGGQVILMGRDRHAMETARQAFDEWRGGGAWLIEQGPAVVHRWPGIFGRLGVGGRVHYLAARKVMLVPPGLTSERFTYHVTLERRDASANARHAHHAGADRYEVVKRIPTVERVLARLREKFPEADEETLTRRARKFTEKVFPLFLTREAAMLKLLHRDLPPEYRHRVPRLLHAEHDAQGFVRELRMNWLRNGRPAREGSATTAGAPLTQLAFARQAAELLAALHDHAGIMHLDLRLDNVVITPRGVGFVDFSSAVRIGENLAESPLLGNLFEEMMRTSQIQRMLGKMSDAGQVTSEEIRGCYGRVDKDVDVFFLAVQMTNPHHNPDFRGLVRFDKHSHEAHALSRLTAEILRPADTRKSRFKSARDILHGIQDIEHKLSTKTT